MVGKNFLETMLTDTVSLLSQIGVKNANLVLSPHIDEMVPNLQPLMG